MSRFLNPWLHLGLTVTLVTAAEIFLKRGADTAAAPDRLGLTSLGSRDVWIGTAFLVVSFGSWMLVLRGMALHLAFMLSSVLHVTIPVAAWIFLGEEITAIRWAGIALVCAGVIVMARPASRIEGES